ncbi:hypothetical protein LOC50_01530 [Pseudoalteromonas sp. SCSIO 43095]|uniref:hypothetical protein n=1 Tax=unclassified Pseudoalteromonas TaxID=194690 RepID=UPI00110A0C48|nr:MULTISPECIES: hypothetical protein [unclassified Pseudoalteromonas]TMP54720.1 hypothetical protein CWB78_10575 [Pseudoalteromonas sp. S1612]URQ99023.1 hypothetical protein LOC50_01530 [Pseudoalteromonas sp. SCSIO 43095]
MIRGRYTPWDESALKLRTFEILEIETKNIESTQIELNNNSFCNAELIYGRFPANDFVVKELLFKSGYIACETSFRIALGKLHEYTLPPLYSRRMLPVNKAKKSEFKEIAEIARDMFKFSRFHEDPFIQKHLSDIRMYQWVNELANQDVSCLVNKSNVGDIISFMIYRVNERKQVSLILGGSKKGFEMHSPFFWGSVISYFKSEGVSKVFTNISAANNGVLSLYQNLGFKIIETNVDYHKHV